MACLHALQHLHLAFETSSQTLMRLLFSGRGACPLRPQVLSLPPWGEIGLYDTARRFIAMRIQKYLRLSCPSSLGKDPFGWSATYVLINNGTPNAMCNLVEKAQRRPSGFFQCVFLEEITSKSLASILLRQTGFFFLLVMTNFTSPSLPTPNSKWMP